MLSFIIPVSPSTNGCPGKPGAAQPQVHEAWLFRRGTRGNFAADAAVCAARPPSVRPRHAWRWAFPPPGALRRLCRHAFEHAEAAHVIDQVLHPDLRLGADQADGADQFAAHDVRLVGEHVLDPGAHARAGGVAPLLARGERPVAGRAAVDAAGAPALSEALLNGRRAVG